ncbi:MAG: DUF1347 family protein, partial [Verrucomicrobia bacterium]|nr:DUF1347 family protein [Verrucomicrobiota bacterium]
SGYLGIPSTNFPALKQAAAEKVSHLLATRSFEEALPYIPLCQELVPLELIEDHVVQTAKQDLTQFHASLALWEASHPDRAGKLRLSLLLLGACEEHWGNEQLLILIDQASQLPDCLGQETYRQELSRTLKRGYTQALADNNASALLVILKCAKAHNIKTLPAISNMEIANQLADIRHLLQLGRALEANKIAQWLIEVNPSSSEIQALLDQMLEESSLAQPSEESMVF